MTFFNFGGWRREKKGWEKRNLTATVTYDNTY